MRERFIIGRDFIGADDVALILGDNIFYGHGLPELMAKATARRAAARPFSAIVVSDPERYGVVEFDARRESAVDRGKADDSRSRTTR